MIEFKHWYNNFIDIFTTDNINNIFVFFYFLPQPVGVNWNK